MNFYLSLPYMESQVFKIVKLILQLWHFKLHLSILLNKMASPQNCSYHKSTLIVMLILYLWQITVKFNITPLIVTKLLPSSTLNLWQSPSSGFHIETEMSDAKFNITPLASSSLLSSTLYLCQWLFLMLHIEAEMSDAKFNITPLASNSLLSSTIHLWQWLSLELSYRSRDDQC